MAFWKVGSVSFASSSRRPVAFLAKLAVAPSTGVSIFVTALRAIATDTEPLMPIDEPKNPEAADDVRGIDLERLHARDPELLERLIQETTPRIRAAVREAAAPTMEVSGQQIQKLVRATLAAAAETVSRPERRRSFAWWPRLDLAAARELAVSWGCLANGGATGGVERSAVGCGGAGPGLLRLRQLPPAGPSHAWRTPVRNPTARRFGPCRQDGLTGACRGAGSMRSRCLFRSHELGRQ